MSVEGFFVWLPVWVIFLATLAATGLATELGFRSGLRMRGRLAEKEDDIRPGPFATAALSLAAFMLALAFGTVQSRLHDVKQVALDEANAIGTTYLRADLLPEADRGRVREILREYLELRLRAVDRDIRQEQAAQAMARSVELHRALWIEAATVADQVPTDISALFVDSVNEMIDLYSLRITMGLQFHLPAFAWLVLYGLSILALWMGGYANGYAGSRRSVTLAVSIALAYSVVLAMLVSMDRTERHLSSISSSVMVGFQEGLRDPAGP